VNINTTLCLERLTTFLEEPSTIEKYPHKLSPTALVEALHIVMEKN
jgi:hypothetical protein